jgi:hypothetical protein
MDGGLVYASHSALLKGPVFDFERTAQAEFIVSGAFEDDQGDMVGIARLDGTAPQFIEVPIGEYTSNALTVLQDYIYFDAYNGSSSVIYRFHRDSVVVEEVLRTDGKVNVLEQSSEVLHVGGSFSTTMHAQDTLVHPNYAVWDGDSLKSLECPFSAEVKDIALIEGKLYVVGGCDPEDADHSCIQVWDGVAWTSALDSLTLARLALYGGDDDAFNDIHTINDTVVLGGNFRYCDAGTFNYSCSQHLAVLGNGTLLPYGYFNGSVHSVSKDGMGKVIVGGAFTTHTYHYISTPGPFSQQFSTFPVPYLAQSAPNLLGTTKIVGSAPGLLIYPNPTQGMVSVDVGSSVQSWTVLDLKGSVVRPQVVRSESGLRIDVSQLRSGIYLLEVSDHEGSIHRGEIVVGPY